MDYNPFDQNEIPEGERSLPQIIATIRTVNGFPSGNASFTKENFQHPDYQEIATKICEGILKNVGNNPNTDYRISIEGRGQASGNDTQQNTELAVHRARQMMEAFHDFLLEFEATKNGETRSIRQYINQRQLFLKTMDVKPYFDPDKGTASWIDGAPGDARYQRAKVNIYYESRGYING